MGARIGSILVFGGTGGTGKELIQQALRLGYDVTAVVRNPSSFPAQYRACKVVEGNVLEPSTFEDELIGQNAVVSCLGEGTSTKPTTVYSQGMRTLFLR